jgi:hypothetical protein
MREGASLVQGRLHVLRRLGQGGMGTVYLTHDAERQCNVALKTLNQLEAQSIYALKNEFRALQDVHHPNLVRLHELFCEDDAWFFTMDLVEGERFDRWVRPHGELDEPRLRAALVQLIDALDAIHAVGKLHRDIKPSNVLVNSAGKLFVLDFGLVIDPTVGTVGQTVTDTDVTGTPDYMAPEQAAGRATTTATDFYAVGVMIFEALMGRRPFEGSLGEILAAKQRDLPPVPRGPNVPPDLAELSTALLARDAEARPKAAEIRARLAISVNSSVSEVRTLTAREDDSGQLLGREAELMLLRDAYAATSGGASVVVGISGESGMGKTVLCQAFLDEIRGQGHAVVLSGRCYEHENVPFKVIDPLIDELSRHLRRLSHARAAALLPRDAFALAQLFPVLMRVPAFAEAPVKPVPAARELQRLAFAAFGELLGRIRDRQPLVIHVDDLQWGDADSAKFLRQLLLSRLQVAVLLVASYRAEDELRNPHLRSIIDAAKTNRSLDVRQLRLTPLTDADTEALARRLLGPTHASGAIASEARGNPFFAMELARFARSGSEAAAGARILSLPAVIESRVAALPAPARRLLQALAIAGQPLPVSVLVAASGAEHSDIDALRAEHLVRGSGERTGERVLECYHDRVRESVAAACTPSESRELQRGLARALADREEPELQSRCLEGAGEFALAAQHAARAAERAATSLAFDHAAALYQRALTLTEAASDPAAASELAIRELTILLGRSLENAGRGVEAAEAYLRAAELAQTANQRLELRRRATEQLLLCGQAERGSQLLYALAAELDIKIPNSPSAALMSLAWNRMTTRLHEQPPARAAVLASDELSETELLRLHTLETAVIGLTYYFPMFAASVSHTHYRAAHQCAAPIERARAIGLFAHIHCLLEPHGQRAVTLLAQTDVLARALGGSSLLGFNQLIQGCGAFTREEYAPARACFEQARKSLRECTGMEWERDATHVYDQLSAFYAGDHADIARDTPALLEEARRRQRVWTVAMLSGFSGSPAWLASDDVQGYRRQLADARTAWSSHAGSWPDYVLLFGEVLLALYEGEPERGYGLIETQREAYQRSLLSRKLLLGRLGFAYHQGSCAAAALAQRGLAESRRPQLLAALRSSIALLSKREGQRTIALHLLLTAALHWSTGAREQALSELQQAVRLLERAGLRVHTAAAQRRLGLLLGGDEGARLVTNADAYLRSQGIRELEPTTEVHCPGFVVSGV